MGIKFENFLKYDYKTRATLFSVGVFLFIFLLIFFSQYFRPALLKVSFYDVGQGDAIFIETPARYQVLIDGGPGAKILEEIARDMPFYDRTIDLVIATHPDADHISGLVDVLERYAVRTILLPKLESSSLIYQRFLNAIINEQAEVKQAIGFQKIELPGGVSFEILNPRQKEEYGNNNDASVVSIVDYGEIEFLLLADVGKTQERAILPLISQEIEFVKVAHHGSKSSSDREFLAALSPDVAIIQVGKDNRYGHPAKEVLASIRTAGSKIWRTDTMGALTILSDGEKYWVK